MDDVDRLFECFKCGVNPPESALKERQKCKVDKPNRSTLAKGEASNQSQPAKKEEKPNRAKHISPLVFYGSPHGVPAKRPAWPLQLLREIRRDLSEENNLSMRRDIWVTFPKQILAMDFAKEHPQACLFSYQDHVTGQRRFLVSTYEEFWRRHKSMDSRFRHHYEVIQEGMPCHLYFDLEFDKRVNLEKNGDEMVDALISVVFDVLLDKYCMHGEEDWVVELDSTTEGLVCSRICSAQENDHRLQTMFISKDTVSEFPRKLFVDTAVYSPNRCFRLALSSKAGKKSVLLPTRRFKCKNLCEEDMFMDSLICKIDDDCQKLLICKMDLDCVKTLCFNSEVNSSHGCTKDLPTTYFVGKSPFPALDIFVESVASVENVSGKIRSWYWFSEYGLIVYNMLRSRFCERIGRQHKSNNVMYIVDFKRAVYYKKCYDSDCKGYRSPFRQIPEDVIHDTSAFFNATQSYHYEVANNDLQYQPDQNEMDPYDFNQSITDSCKKDEWWLEAIKVADEIEQKRQTPDADKLVPEQGEDFDEEDHEWWMAVERTASQLET